MASDMDMEMETETETYRNFPGKRPQTVWGEPEDNV